MCTPHWPEAGLLKEARRVFLRKTAQETYMEVQQENEPKEKPCTGISWPAGGGIAHFKAAVGARYPTMVESLKSHPPHPPPPLQKNAPIENNAPTVPLPCAKNTRIKLQPNQSSRVFPVTYQPSLPSLALQRPKSK